MGSVEVVGIMSSTVGGDTDEVSVVPECSVDAVGTNIVCRDDGVRASLELDVIAWSVLQSSVNCALASLTPLLWWGVLFVNAPMAESVLRQ